MDELLVFDLIDKLKQLNTRKQKVKLISYF